MQISFCILIAFQTNFKNNKHRKNDNKFSQLKVLFTYLLVYSQKQSAFNYRIKKTVHASKFG